MNLEESNSYHQEIESRDRKRRAVMLSIILCGVFIALLFIMIIILSYQDSITEKFFINGQRVTNLNSSVYKEIDGEVYIDIKTLSKTLGYSYTKGEYQKYNENDDSCYIQNDYEIVSLSAGDTSYNKYIELTNGSVSMSGITVTAKSSSDVAENYKIKSPIVFENEKIYVPLESIPKMLNVKIDWQEYRKKIYTLENRVAAAQNAISGKYAKMSGYYENLRAILDGYVIVSKSTSTPEYYGVYSLNESRELISMKYDDITYIQNVGEFYITVENGTMGLLNAEGGTIIKPSEFQQISLLDDDGENQLYLVRKGQEYGVVSRTGEVLVHAENDKIGLDENKLDEFSLYKIRNSNVLFDSCIPVKKDGKYGLFNKAGKQILNISYEGFGYKSTAAKTSGNEQSVLLIPPSVGIKGIVVNYNDMYGIFDTTTEKLIIPCVYNKVYAITKNGKTTYYMEYNGNAIELKDYLEDNALNNVDEEGNALKTKAPHIPTEEDEDEEDKDKAKIQTNANVISSENVNNTENTNTVDNESSNRSSEDNEDNEGNQSSSSTIQAKVIE